MTWAQRTMCGKVAKVAAASEDKAETPEERAEREQRERRLHTLTCFVVAMGIVEGTSSTMTSALFLLLPLNPAIIGGAPVPWHYVLKIWAIQVFFCHARTIENGYEVEKVE